MAAIIGIDGIIAEMRSKPHTLLLLAGLYVGGGIMWTNQKNFASAADLQNVTNQIAQLNVTVQKAALTNRWSALNADLYNWTAKHNDLARKGQSDPLVDARIRDLNTEIQQVQQELARLR